MLEHALNQELLSLTEINNLRLEAMRLFEDCLTSGDETALVEFIQRQLASNPPQLHLLHEIADDLQQRLLSLREHHFDVRERVVSTLSESYEIDITPLAPADQLAHYHQLHIETLMAFIQQRARDISEDELAMLRNMLAASLDMAGQLHRDIQMAQHLHTLLWDWLHGLNSLIIRQHWPATARIKTGHDLGIQH